MELFEATAFDLKQLTGLFNLYRIFYEQKDNPEECHNFLKERLALKDSVIYIAFEESTAIGFVQLYPIFSSVQLKKRWLLNDLFVLEEHRKKGIARSLIAKSKELAKATGADGLLLSTAKTNKEGNALYPSEGFTLSFSNYYFWAIPKE